jgi:hypothetical protein
MKFVQHRTRRDVSAVALHEGLKGTVSPLQRERSWLPITRHKLMIRTPTIENPLRAVQMMLNGFSPSARLE